MFYLINVTIACCITGDFPQAHFKQILVLGMADVLFLQFYRSALIGDIECCYKPLVSKEKVSH